MISTVCSSEVMHKLQQTQHSSFSKVASPSAPEQETAASASPSTTVSEAAAPRLDRRGDRGVPLLGLNYVLHPLFKCMGARGECT